MSTTDLSISAILPTYNRAQLIKRSITSVLSQLEDGDELIIVDDGSTDDTEKVISEFKDRLKYIKTPNRGAGAARNRGVKEARNPLVAFLDSDDVWIPGKTKIQRSFMKARSDILFCFSNCAFRTKKGEEKRFTLHTWHEDTREWDEILGPSQRISSIIPLSNKIPDFNYYVGDIYLSALLYGNYLNVNTLLVRRQEADDALHFAEDTSIYEEWECLGRLARIGSCAYFDCETAWQNAHSGPRITDADGLDRVTAQISIMERVWGMDKVFLKANNELYRSVLNEKRCSKIGGLILRGQTKKARKEIDKLEKCTFPHRILAGLPGWVAKPVAKVLHSLRHGFK